MNAEENPAADAEDTRHGEPRHSELLRNAQRNALMSALVGIEKRLREKEALGPRVDRLIDLVRVIANRAAR